MNILVVLLILLLNACSVFVGLSGHLEAHDKPEIQLDNPLGYIRTEYREGRYMSFCEHTSGLFTRERGIGLNECGFGILLNP